MTAAPVRKPRIPFAVLLLSLVVGALALLLALNTASAANELDRHDAAAADSELSAQLIQLQNQIAASAAPANIARVAGELGMVPAGNPAFLRQDADGRYVVLGSPAPATQPPLPRQSTSAAKKKAPAKPSSTATSTAKPTSTATPTTTPTRPGTKPTSKAGTKPTTKPTSKPTGAAKSSTTPTAPASPTSTPPTTPTPDPTISLPGGAR